MTDFHDKHYIYNNIYVDVIIMWILYCERYRGYRSVTGRIARFCSVTYFIITFSAHVNARHRDRQSTYLYDYDYNMVRVVVAVITKLRLHPL